jgi:ABC-type Mn2+/Zn2+ transport system ATPase subunit
MADYQEILSMSGIGKTYNEPVLSHINLTLYAGKVLALTGENGAGKSTLSKIIGGLITPNDRNNDLPRTALCSGQPQRGGEARYPYGDAGAESATDLNDC